MVNTRKCYNVYPYNYRRLLGKVEIVYNVMANVQGVDMVGQIKSHYKILEKITVGGMDIVYKTKDPTQGRIRTDRPDVSLR